MVRRAALIAMLAAGVSAGAHAQLTAEGGPIQVNADDTEVRERRREVVVSGNVDIIQGQARLRANQVILNYSSRSDASRATGIGGGFGDITSMRAIGEVFYVTPDLKARGDEGVYDAATETILMTGEVILNRGEDVARGCALELNIAENRTQLRGCDGRVQMVIFPEEDAEAGEQDETGDTGEDSSGAGDPAP